MGNLLNSFLFPAPDPSYTYASIPSPPLHTIDGCLVYFFNKRVPASTVVPARQRD